MDIIWVPDSGNSANGSDDGSSPMAKEFLLFLLGFIVLAGCAACGSLLVDGEVAKIADKFGMTWIVDLVAVVPWFGYLFVTVGALVGIAKSHAPIKRKAPWFIGTQLVAAALWFASTLH